MTKKGRKISKNCYANTLDLVVFFNTGKLNVFIYFKNYVYVYYTNTIYYYLVIDLACYVIYMMNLGQQQKIICFVPVDQEKGLLLIDSVTRYNHYFIRMRMQ